MDRFFDRRLDGYDEHMLTCIESADTFYTFTADRLPGHPEARILDLGCGTGLELERYLPRNPTARITGIDLAPGMLGELARKLAGYDLDLRLGSYFDLPFGDACYDAAVSVESLHHFTGEEKLPLYRKLRSALKPGGYFILTDYFAPSDEAETHFRREYLRLRSEQGIEDTEFYHYDTPLTTAHETNVLLQAGFCSVEILGHWGNTYTLKATTKEAAMPNYHADANLRIMSSNIWSGKIFNRETMHGQVYRRYLPDSIGMQERVTRWQSDANSFNRSLADEYTEVEVDIGGHVINCTPIFYRTATLELLNAGWHYFSGLNDVGSKTITWAHFAHKATGARFIHLNTHFYWTGDEAGNKARLGDAEEMHRLVGRLTARFACPILCTGDYNCRMESEPGQKLLAYGFRDTLDLAAGPRSTTTSHHPYPVFDEEAQIYRSAPMPAADPARAIDHILLWGEANVLAHVTVTDEDALTASDHCPLYVDVKL